MTTMNTLESLVPEEALEFNRTKDFVMPKPSVGQIVMWYDSKQTTRSGTCAVVTEVHQNTVRLGNVRADQPVTLNPVAHCEDPRLLTQSQIYSAGCWDFSDHDVKQERWRQVIENLVRGGDDSRLKSVEREIKGLKMRVSKLFKVKGRAEPEEDDEDEDDGDDLERAASAAGTVS
jgi:hypothetical protein